MGLNFSTYNRTFPIILPLLILAAILFKPTENPTTPVLAAVAVKMPDTPSSSSNEDVISHLKVSIRQVSTSPPQIALAVANTHDQPVTILRWNSPLDPLALQLGLVSFVPEDGDAPPAWPIPTVQLRRRMPPGPEELVTIASGGREERVLELRAPVAPLERLRGEGVAAGAGAGKVRVLCSGRWLSVWLGEAGDVPQESLENAGASEDAFKGIYRSEAVEIQL
ncbi:hypothetical protein M426DRAFT_324758 [Hypoxylon sp. CI-4A]|nr:hypothetical protein M426DRAFT_324758 [Hypoxylon sp. CI-4A]